MSDLLLGVVPARGGSQRLRRKNLLPVNGKPLVLHAADKLNQVCDAVVVSTDDPEIASVADMWGYPVHHRGNVTDEQTVAQVAQLVVDDFGYRCEIEGSDVLLLQPTVPFADLETWLATIDRNDPAAGSYELHEAKIRTGVYYWPAGKIGPIEVRGYWEPIDGGDIDIDTVEDYHRARIRSERKRILIEYIEGPDVGTGHRHRAYTLAAALQHHDVDLAQTAHGIHGGITSSASPTAAYDMVITDTLDNKSRPHPHIPLWVTFEDMGPVVAWADLVVNALYPGIRHETVESGPEWVVLRPEFLHTPPFEVRKAARLLVMFGGTDPANLHDLIPEYWCPPGLDPIPYGITRVKPGDQISVAAAMLDHDILITSAGRTVYEAAAVGIPTVVLAQNNREATHVHLGPDHGNIYLGLGSLANSEEVAGTVDKLAVNPRLRQELSDTARASIDGKGLDRIVHKIDGILKGL